MMEAFGEPSPKTVCVSFFHRSHARQSQAARRKLASDSRSFVGSAMAALAIGLAMAERSRPFVEAFICTRPARELCPTAPSARSCCDWAHLAPRLRQTSEPGQRSLWPAMVAPEDRPQLAAKPAPARSEIPPRLARTLLGLPL